jgi:DNA-directed RNA polymerase subunit beta
MLNKQLLQRRKYLFSISKKSLFPFQNSYTSYLPPSMFITALGLFAGVTSCKTHTFGVSISSALRQERSNPLFGGAYLGCLLSLFRGVICCPCLWGLFASQEATLAKEARSNFSTGSNAKGQQVNAYPKGGLKGQIPKSAWKSKQSQLYKEQNKKLNSIEYSLDTFHRSNQDTCLVHKPAVFEGDWVQSGDLLADCSASVGGELALGHNILVAYMPWEGYNYEDAILLSERLVYDEVYTSIHIERYEISTRETKTGTEKITRDIPDASPTEISLLDEKGIAKLGSWVEEGDILVGKITPISKKSISNYQNLLNKILGKELKTLKDSSLRAPKGIKAKVIKIQVLNYNLEKPHLIKNASFSKSPSKKKRAKLRCSSYATRSVAKSSLSPLMPYPPILLSLFRKSICFFPEDERSNPSKTKGVASPKHGSKSDRPKQMGCTKGLLGLFATKGMLKLLGGVASVLGASNTELGASNTEGEGRIGFASITSGFAKVASCAQLRSKIFGEEANNKQGQQASGKSNSSKWKKKPKQRAKQVKIPTNLQIYLAEKRKIQVGDKMAGRHGNKGIISQIFPRQDMPFLPDGTPIDIVLNPLGVPSRMNVGQLYECLLGLAGKYLGEQYKIFPFDEIYGPEASRSFVYSKLYEARQKTGFKWLFNPSFPGKIRIYDGCTGDSFHQAVTVGRAYILKLVHMVDDKIHARSTGPYSLVTQQPLRGRSKTGGQRLGEMEVWAIEGYGAAFTLLEMLTIKSDDMRGRIGLWSSIIYNKEISIGTPEAFNVLVHELQALCLDIGLF